MASEVFALCRDPTLGQAIPVRLEAFVYAGQRLGNRASALGLRSDFLEFSVGNPRNLRAAIQLDLVDLGSGSQMHRGRRMNLVRHVSLVGEQCSQKHGETAGMGGAD